MSWLFFSLLAPLVWALTNIIDKYVLSKLVKDPWVPAIAFGFAGAIASLLIFLLRGFAAMPLIGISIALLAGLVYFIAELYYFKAAKLEEISRVISLIYLDPLFTAVLAAIFLNEIFSALKYLGVLLLVAGAFLISYKFEGKFQLKKAVWLAIFSAALFGICNLLNKYLLGQGDFWTIFAYIRIGSFLALLPVIFGKRKKIFMDIVINQPRGWLIVFNAFLTLLGTLVFFIALSLGYATFTSALSALQPFFVLMMTIALGALYPHILKEAGGRMVFAQKLVAVILMFAGVALINPW